MNTQTRLLQVELDSITYKEGAVTMSIIMPKYKNRLSEAEAAIKMRNDLVSKIIDEGIERTPYNRKFDIDKSIGLDELVRFIGPDIHLYDLVMEKSTIYASCTFDIKHIERKLMDNGYLRKFGV